MAPTTIPSMKTSTSPYGRNTDTMGNHFNITEMIAHIEGVYFVTRQAVHTAAAVRKTKRAIRTAFENQKLKKGISIVEVVSNCNSGWKMTPLQANQWMEENMFPYYPLGDVKINGEMA